MKFHTSSAEEMPSPPLEPSSLESCVSTRFSFRSYQRDDLARAAMHDGAIIGWDPGLGKTMAIFSLPFLKQARHVLIVAPAGLHEQIMDEGREKFGIEVTPIPNQDAALDLMRRGILPMPGKRIKDHGSEIVDSPSLHPQSSIHNPQSQATPAFFITSYTWLGYNGGDEWQEKEPNELIRARRLQILNRCLAFPDPDLATALATAEWKPKDKTDPWTILSLPKKSSPDRICLALKTAARLFHPTVQPGDPDVHWRWHRIFTTACELLGLHEAATDTLAAELALDPALLASADALQSIETGIGHEKEIEDCGYKIADSSNPQSTIHNHQSSISSSFTIKCVFRPTLASLICGVFDFTVCDEAVRLKSGTAYQAIGVLRMASRCRYALTGTPIKNKLPDFFFLASWVTGHTSDAIARWPYGNTVEHRGQFSRDFGVVELNLTKQEDATIRGKKAPPPKTTNKICNVHRLWRILGPVIIRRRKDDVPDCNIVTKTIVPIRVMPGKEQKKVYSYHLTHAPDKRSALASIGAQLQNLRQAALNPSSLKLTHGGKDGRSTSLWTPKFTAILKLAADLLPSGEQLVIFSPFQDFSTSLAGCFRDAGVPHLVLDGNLTPAKRGTMIKRFKDKSVPILIAGIDSMGEGYSLDNARHLVLPSLSWAFDSNTQAVERVHRLTSKQPVTIYCMVTQGTIDERLTSIWQEKGDSSDLALDGRLTTQDRKEIDLGTLLRDAVKDFDPKAPSLDEEEVRQHWLSTLLPALTAAGKTYQLKIADSGSKIEAKEPRKAPLPIHNPQSTTRPGIATGGDGIRNHQSPRPRSLFDLMKNNRTNNTPPSEIKNPQPSIDNPQSQPQGANIIPFPGLLGTRPPISNLQSPIHRPGPTMPKVNLAALIRRTKS